MNQFTQQIEAALRELRAWRQSPPTEDQTSSGTYEVIERGLREAEFIVERSALYTHLAGLNRFICDQGPLSGSFIPSFRSLFLSVHGTRIA